MILTVIQYIPSTTLGNDPTYQVDFTVVDSLNTNYTLKEGWVTMWKNWMKYAYQHDISVLNKTIPLPIIYHSIDVQRQNNSYDCGPHAIAYARAFSEYLEQYIYPSKHTNLISSDDILLNLSNVLKGVSCILAADIRYDLPILFKTINEQQPTNPRNANLNSTTTSAAASTTSKSRRITTYAATKTNTTTDSSKNATSTAAAATVSSLTAPGVYVCVYAFMHKCMYICFISL